jgi:enoyl-CoA hydratase
MPYETLIVEAEEGVATITLNRPQALNAINTTMLHELLQALDALERDPSIRCVILTGAGDRAFSAGADIKEMKEKTPLEAMETGMLGHRVADRLERFRTPVIAAVNGIAFGGGCELALACDFIIASDAARFGQPEVNLGIHPGWGGTMRLPWHVGKGWAKQMIFTGEAIDATTAKEIGLVNLVVPADRLLQEARNIARTIAKKAPVAVQMAKLAINTGLDTDLRTAAVAEVESFAVCFATEDRREGISAFLEKREPQFKGR